MHGLHHITAITSKAKENLGFYTGVLGLRLVKKTVNQDDTTAYHLFYADGAGSPGTDMTFFDWPQSEPKKLGTDTISASLFRVASREALEYWKKRLSDFKAWHSDIEEVAGVEQLRFEDPEGQSLVLVNDRQADFDGVFWTGGGIEEAYAIRGFYGVELTVPTLEHIHFIFTKVLGWSTGDKVAAHNDDYRSITTYTTDKGQPGSIVRVVMDDRLEPAWTSQAGAVHHVAFRVKDVAALEGWRNKLDTLGLPNSDIVDRYYFRSLYFRVSRGILFELATDGPGFTADEPLESLGEALSLPPFLEPQRSTIEANLKPLTD